jgi:hypothetical protein
MGLTYGEVDSTETLCKTSDSTAENTAPFPIVNFEENGNRDVCNFEDHHAKNANGLVVPCIQSDSVSPYSMQ